MNGQISLFDYLEEQNKPEPPKCRRLEVGTMVGKVVLGEVLKARITEVEGNGEFFFYRTDKGMCFDADSRTDIAEMEAEAERNRKLYPHIEVDGLDQFFAVEYAPRKCDGRVLYGMAGIYRDMLFWEGDITYQFLEIPKNRTDLEKQYKKKVEELKRFNPFDKEEREYKVLPEPIPIHRLYWCERYGVFGSADYAEHNGCPKWATLPKTSRVYEVLGGR